MQTMTTRTPQEPIHSGFGPTTTARETLRGIDLTGKTAIVTGGYTGIGLETTRALVEAGATVIVPARSRRKAQEALAGLPRVEQEPLDLLDPSTIERFAEGFLASGRPLHILINNAGIMAPPLARDTRGYESQFSANHLGHFELTARLLPALRQASGARVVSVSSRGHRRSPVDFDDPNYEHRPYDRWEAYGQSKTANVLFAVALDRRGESDGIRAFSVHPGGILTGLSQYMTDEELASYGISRANLAGGPIPVGLSVAEGGLFKTTEQGAATSVWCATSPRLTGMGGVYCQDVDIAVIAEPDSPVIGVAPYAIDPAAADRLWVLSERLTGVMSAPPR